MIEDVLLAALPPFVRSVTEGFVQEHKGSVSILEIQDRVVGMVRAQEAAPGEAASYQYGTRSAVTVLVRYLTLTQSGYFYVEADQLTFSAGPHPHGHGHGHGHGQGQTHSVHRVMDDFTRDVESKVERIARQRHAYGAGTGRGTGRGAGTGPVGRQVRRTRTTSDRPHIDERTSRVLNDFFADFESEIRGARLGDEGDQEINE